MATQKFVLGAYASLPAGRENQEDYYALLRAQEWVSGLEVPYPGDIADDPRWLADQLAHEWDQTSITVIPGTMKQVGANPTFGLASTDEAGRAAALEYVAGVRRTLLAIAERNGRPSVSRVQLHSAPTNGADADAFARSLEELLGQDWGGARLVVEHCDAPRAGRKPEKGFLEIADEVAVAAKVGAGIYINWGRSCLEERDAEAPLRHIELAGQAGVLEGVIFSGAGPEETRYGYSWIDGHLPARADEPSSLLGDAEVAACAKAARGYNPDVVLGAKICVPEDAILGERVAMLKRICDAAR
ncbi:DUF4862 family protein [Dermabacteraceae bacterium P13101]